MTGFKGNDQCQMIDVKSRRRREARAVCHLTGISRFITHDTGPMHVAAALDVPLVALFSVPDPAATGPRGPGGQHTVLESAAPCHLRGRRQAA